MFSFPPPLIILPSSTFFCCTRGCFFFSFSFLPSAYSYSCIFSFLLLLLLIFHSSSLSSSYLFVKTCFFLLFPVVSLFEFKSHPSLFLFLLRPIGRRSAMGVLAPPLLRHHLPTHRLGTLLKDHDDQ